MNRFVLYIKPVYSDYICILCAGQRKIIKF